MEDKEIKAKPGDKISLKTASDKINGVLLESYDKDSVLIKLDSGYNVGVKKEEVEGVKILGKSQKHEEKIKAGENKKVPYIGMIVTGGTISSRLDYSTGGVKWLINSQ